MFDLSQFAGAEQNPAEVFAWLKESAESIPNGCEAVYVNTEFHGGLFFIDENAVTTAPQDAYTLLKFFMPKAAARMVTGLVKNTPLHTLAYVFSKTVRESFYLTSAGECFILGTTEKLPAEISPFDYSKLSEMIKEIFASGAGVELPSEISEMLRDVIAAQAGENPQNTPL